MIPPARQVLAAPRMEPPQPMAVDLEDRFSARGDSSPPPASADPLDQVEGALDGLLEGYRESLRCCASLPRFGLVGGEPPAPTGEAATNTPPAKGAMKTVRRRWVARPLVRRMLRGHIRRKLTAALAHLKVEAMAEKEPSPRAQRLKGMVERLEGVHGSLFGGRKPDSLRGGLLPTLTVAIASVTAIATGGETSNPLSAFQAIGESTQSGRWVDVAGGVALIVLFACIFLVPLVVRYGFWAKRSLLLGAQDGAAVWEVRHRQRRIHFRVPGSNTYAAEDRLFSLLSGPKTKEFAWDAVLSFWALFGLMGFVTLTADTISRTLDGHTPTSEDWEYVGYYGAWVLATLLSGFFVVRRRSKPGLS